MLPKYAKYVVTVRFEVESESPENVRRCLPWAFTGIRHDTFYDEMRDEDGVTVGIGDLANEIEIINIEEKS